MEKLSFIANSVAPRAALIWYNVLDQSDGIPERFNLMENPSIALENSRALIINNPWNVARQDITTDATLDN